MFHLQALAAARGLSQVGQQPYDRADGCLAATALAALACICCLPFADDPSWGAFGVTVIGAWLFYHMARYALAGRCEAMASASIIGLFALAWSLDLAWSLAGTLSALAVIAATAKALWTIRRPVRS